MANFVYSASSIRNTDSHGQQWTESSFPNKTIVPKRWTVMDTTGL